MGLPFSRRGLNVCAPSADDATRKHSSPVAYSRHMYSDMPENGGGGVDFDIAEPGPGTSPGEMSLAVQHTPPTTPPPSAPESGAQLCDAGVRFDEGKFKAFVVTQ